MLQVKASTLNGESKLADEPLELQQGRATIEFEEVYRQLRALAHAWFRRLPPGQTLQPTAVVNEAFARLAAQGRLDPGNRSHAFGILVRAMRAVMRDKKKGIKASYPKYAASGWQARSEKLYRAAARVAAALDQAAPK